MTGLADAPKTRGRWRRWPRCRAGVQRGAWARLAVGEDRGVVAALQLQEHGRAERVVHGGLRVCLVEDVVEREDLWLLQCRARARDRQRCLSFTLAVAHDRLGALGRLDPHRDGHGRLGSVVRSGGRSGGGRGRRWRRERRRARRPSARRGSPAGRHTSGGVRTHWSHRRCDGRSSPRRRRATSSRGHRSSRSRSMCQSSRCWRSRRHRSRGCRDCRRRRWALRPAGRQPIEEHGLRVARAHGHGCLPAVGCCCLRWPTPNNKARLGLFFPDGHGRAKTLR